VSSDVVASAAGSGSASRGSHPGAMLAMLAALCWGMATVMSKGALSGFPPLALLTIQLAASVIVLWIALMLRGVSLPGWREGWRFAWLGLLEPGLAYLFALIGLSATGAGSATLIGATESVMIAALAALLLKERITLLFGVLSAVAIGGLILAVGLKDMESDAFVGDAFILAGTAAAALYVVLSSRAASRHDPILIVACQHSLALLFSLPLVTVELASRDSAGVATISPSLWALAIASGVVQNALAFSFYLGAMRFISTSLAGAFLLLAPIVTLTGAGLFLGESVTLMQLAGGALTIGALAMMSLSRNAQAS
jgi:drug/metabolite transporter (DMT)-like permease